MKINNTISALCTPKWIGIWLGVSLVVYVLFLTISLWEDIQRVLALPAFLPVVIKIWAIVMLYAHPLLHLSWLTLGAVITVAALTGCNVVLVLYIKNRRAQAPRGLALSSSTVSGLLVSLGMGCAACGSAVLVGVLGWVGVAVSASLVSWVTQVLLLLSVAVLLYSNYRLYQQAKNPLVCNI